MRKRLVLLFVALWLACVPTPPPKSGAGSPIAPAPFRFEGHAPVVAPHAMVVTDARIATNVGQGVLARGGNAVDAAIATAFALAVVYPAAGNVGGGGFMIARMHGTSYALDFRETAPAAASHDTFASHPEDAMIGVRSAGVPGSVAGLYAAYEKLGSKRFSWAELVAPAVALAEQGFETDEDFVSMVTEEVDRLQRFEGSRALYLPDGKPFPLGLTWKNPDLAATLRRVAERGPAGFYEGPTAEAIVREMQSGDGMISLEDLRAYEPKWRTALDVTYRGKKLVTMPPPSSGGVTIGMICHILDGYDVPHLRWHSPEQIHLEVEAMRRAFAARNARLGDPDFVTNPTAELLSSEWARAQRASIAANRATPSREIQAGQATAEGPHTTHFSIVDGAGNAVALTTTINEWFGSGVTVRGAGFVLNDEMDDFAAVVGKPNGYGLVQAEPNAVAPHKRMLSAMSPTIVLDARGEAELVVGGAGGPTIISGVFQAISNVVDFGEDAATALGHARVHMQHRPDVVSVEEGGLAPETARALEAMGYTLRQRHHIADIVAIGRNRTAACPSCWLGAAEPRRPGGLALGL